MSGNNAPEAQRAWEKFIADCNWQDVENWWLEWFFEQPDQKEPLRALLVRLRELVPKITVKNGVEKTERHILRSDDERHWSGREWLKGAADILELGELEAAVEGHPPESSEIWHNYTTQVRDELQQYLTKPEVTDGAHELSRKVHAQDALEYIDGVDSLISVMGTELPDEDDRRWFEEIMMEAALLAFDAGRHTQEAWTKAFEPLAVVRQKSIDALAHTNEGRRTTNERRKTQANAWQQHAAQVQANCSRNITKAALSIYIWKNWDAVGNAENRPPRPEKRTIQNWLSKRK